MGVVNITHEALNQYDQELFNEGTDHELQAPVQPATLLERHTICAPQLLHLDADGKPLWFNGWVLDNKFADKSHKHFATFESFLVEPPVWEGQEPWQLQQDNMCCLTTDPSFKSDFTNAEKETLDMIVRRAKEVEALVMS